MSQEEQSLPPAGMAAVVLTLVPVLGATATVIFLSVGYTVQAVGPGLAVSQTLLAAGWLFAAVTALSLGVVAVALLVSAVRSVEIGEGPAGSAVSSGRFSSGAADRALRIASSLVGAHRAHLREEWAGLLAGDPETGLLLRPGRRLGYALGFLWAAVRLRLRDLVSPLWLPVDWLLVGEARTNRFIALAVGGQAVYIVGDGGLSALFTEVWEPCTLFGAGLYILARWLRRVRGIELAAVRGESSDAD
ncbi:hypothetical protein ACFWBN_31775 [Streptomyces sp. NPDC059989]|uniref:hypothetical protein n=1 Tax=Streptomyces sp. NPDC059989 TaxID=3347026 RepID=UPI00369A51A6